MTGLDLVSAAVGAILGVALSRSTRLVPGAALAAGLVGLTTALGTRWAVALPVTALVIPVGFVMTAMAWHWRQRPEVAHRVVGHLDSGSRGRVAGAELASAWSLVVAATLAALGVIVALAAPGSLASFVGIALALIPVVVAAVMVARPRHRPPPDPSGLVVPTDPVTLLADGSPDRRVVEVLAARSGSRAVACHPPHLFRGLAGWNLGLGLGAEEAAWAGQLARMLGLGTVLAEPAPLVDAAQVKMLVVCRALASDGDPVILDEPAAGLDAARARDLARVVAIGVGGRRLVVVTADPAGHRSFVSRARTRQ